MRFSRYPKPEPYQVISRKLVAANHAVQAQKDKYPLIPRPRQAPKPPIALISLNVGVLQLQLPLLTIGFAFAAF